MNANEVLLVRLIAEMEDEIKSLTLLRGEMNDCLKMGLSHVVLRAKASVLHDFYTGIERIFTKIASELNGGLPNTPQWHIELLRDMSLPLEGVRPAVVTSRLRDALVPFLRFRHLFLNLYGFDLEPKRLYELVDLFPETLVRFLGEMDIFIQWLRKLLSS